jgi:8-oxo-dGTP pyrophosphatase MutT (NUDIX family)
MTANRRCRRPRPGTAYADRMTLTTVLPVPIARLVYRVGYVVLRVYWLLFRPCVTGVKCVLTDGDQVLLVRHSYGPRAWDLPGGSVKNGEEPANAARREMQEELGVVIDRWRPLGQLRTVIDHRRDSIHLFQAELHNPQLTIDLGELITARWFPRAELPGLGSFTRRILAVADNVK